MDRTEDYEYHGLMAATWDLFRGDTSDWKDRFFFRQIIQQNGQPVLDVGCGTGRLLLDYLAGGLDIDGVDNSPEMLALCRQKAVELGLKPAVYRQDMATLDLPRHYQTIIVPSSSFQLVTDIAEAALAMQRFYTHLLPGGVLAMPFMILWQEGEPQETEWELSGEATRPEDGALARRWSKARYDVANQLEDTEDRYEVVLGGQVIAAEHHRRSPATRWYDQAQAVALYRTAGFDQIRLYRGFNQEPVAPEDTLFSIVGRKPD